MRDKPGIGIDASFVPELQKETEKPGASTVIIHFIGTPDQAAVQDTMIDYLNASGWRTVEMKKADMEKLTEDWDDAHGITLVNIPLDKANRLVANIRTIFRNHAEYFRLDIIPDSSKRSSKDVSVEQAPAEIQEWIQDFSKKIAGGNLESIANNLCMLGVEDPHHCDCEFFEEETIKWLHDHHQVYNTVVWRLLRDNNMLEPLHEIYTSDSKKSPTEIASPPYGKQLLENFLTRTPHSAWVIV